MDPYWKKPSNAVCCMSFHSFIFSECKMWMNDDERSFSSSWVCQSELCPLNRGLANVHLYVGPFSQFLATYVLPFLSGPRVLLHAFLTRITRTFSDLVRPLRLCPWGLSQEIPQEVTASDLLATCQPFPGTTSLFVPRNPPKKENLESY